ncbi:MAG TPA: hypothetical protein VLG49_03715 [Rhabdochlamydiaceae bacterium]|nr:hypothetical protein [Rhabdochlamydiaceae bacterium]
MSSCIPVLGGIQKIHTDLHSLENQPQSLPNVKAVWERMHSSDPQPLIQLDRKGLGTLSCFPNELLKIFFSKFTLEELARMAPVSKDFNDISINDWKKATGEQCKLVLEGFLKDMEKNKKMIGSRIH